MHKNKIHNNTTVEKTSTNTVTNTSTKYIYPGAPPLPPSLMDPATKRLQAIDVRGGTAVKRE
jgi:hypothetical protein